MAPIFASPDIAAIVAAFPPSSPSESLAGLVRSKPGEELLNSQKVTARLHQKLESDHHRILLRDLPSLLGVEDADWILDCYDGNLSLSSDRANLISLAELRQILDELYHDAKSHFVDLSAWASRHDILQESLDQAQHDPVANSDRRPLKPLGDGSNGTFLHEPALFEQTRHQLREAIEVSSSDPCNLSSSFPKIPNSVLRVIVQGLVSGGACTGSVESKPDGLIFVPSDYGESIQRKAEEAVEAQSEEVLGQIEDGGFVQRGKDKAGLGLRAALNKRLQDPSVHANFLIIDLDDGTWIVATQSAADTALQILTDNARRQMTASWEQNKTDMPTKLSDDKILSGIQAKHGLAASLLHSDFRKAVQAGIAANVLDLTAADRNSFALAMQEKVMAPTQLYAKGVEVISDEATRERLDPYVAQSLRTDILEPAVQSLRADNFLREKSRIKDIDKFSTVLSACQSLGDVTSAVAKLSRKQKLEEPSPALLRRVKVQTLLAKSKGLKRMSRGSDILQNATWILLAQAAHEKGVDAVFMSSGKDTTRMIKAYQTLADTETGKKLEAFRDALKAGQESKEDVNTVKGLADEAVNDMTMSKE